MIPKKHHAHIRAIDVDEHHTHCDYSRWLNTCRASQTLKSSVRKVEKTLGRSFKRSDVLAFYSDGSVQPETKFIAAMIWGHEAPSRGRRDGRGPWKLTQMFYDHRGTTTRIRNIALSNADEVNASYKMLNGKVKRCGPNFFTKHFYFLGKSLGMRNYPVIFDDRVANGLSKLVANQKDLFHMVRISTIRNAEAYGRYLAWVHEQAKRIGCEPDQVEYYLFQY